jgi:hypothetical protein
MVSKNPVPKTQHGLKDELINIPLFQIIRYTFRVRLVEELREEWFHSRFRERKKLYSKFREGVESLHFLFGHTTKKEGEVEQ